MSARARLLRLPLYMAALIPESLAPPLRPGWAQWGRLRPRKQPGSSAARMFPDPPPAAPLRTPPRAHGSPRPQMQVAHNRCPTAQAALGALRAALKRSSSWQGRAVPPPRAGLRVTCASTCGRAGRYRATEGHRDHRPCARSWTYLPPSPPGSLRGPGVTMASDVSNLPTRPTTQMFPEPPLRLARRGTSC